MFAFYLIVGIVVVVCWFLTAILFTPIGKLISRILNDTKEIIEKEEKKDE